MFQAGGGGGGKYRLVEMVSQTLPWRGHRPAVQDILPGHQHWQIPLGHGLQVSECTDQVVVAVNPNMRFRTLDRDSSGTIGFLELILALDLVGATK